MRKIFITIITIGFLLVPLGVYAQSDQMPRGNPPVAQPLVREGDFAVKLVDVLKIGTAKNEAEAETMLGSSGIAPRNGWIADYPVTPDIIGELQSAIGNAADSKRLPMGKDEALKAFGKLSVGLGLPIMAETGKYAESQPPTSYDYTSPTVVNNYYYEEGPPVVTYYPPPWDYYYLYAWVPYPFWWGGFSFSGFFCLHNFHRVVVINANKVVVVSNRFVNPVNHAVVVVDPPTRTSGKTLTSTSTVQKTTTAGFTSSETRKAAGSILERSQERLRTNTTAGMPGGETRRFGSTTVSPSNSRTMGSNQAQTPNTIANQRSSGGEGRSVNSPNVVSGRSSSGPSTGRSFGSSEGSGRSFSAPSRSFSAPSMGSSGSFRSDGGHSFGGSSGGGSNHGGFSGGHAGGGCRGRC